MAGKRKPTPGRSRDVVVMVHHAKVDRWLAFFLGGVSAVEAAFGLGAVAGLGTNTTSPEETRWAGVAMIGVGVLIGLALWGCYRIRYELTPSELVVRFGPFRSSIPLHSIVEVFPTHNPLSAPAPSLDRLRINFRKPNGKVRFTLISPLDREAFLRDLQAAAPHLQRFTDGPLHLKASAEA